jgi:hypothetical protein
VRVIFKIPKGEMADLFPNPSDRPQHLAYIDWYTDFPRHSEPYHRQFKVSPAPAPGGGNLASIVPVTSIVSSVHLLPRFGSTPCNRDWTTSNVLDQCTQFFVNSFGDHDRDIHDLLCSVDNV